MPVYLCVQVVLPKVPKNETVLFAGDSTLHQLYSSIHARCTNGGVLDTSLGPQGSGARPKDVLKLLKCHVASTGRTLILSLFVGFWMRAPASADYLNARGQQLECM